MAAEGAFAVAVASASALAVTESPVANHSAAGASPLLMPIPDSRCRWHQTIPSAYGAYYSPKAGCGGA